MSYWSAPRDSVVSESTPDRYYCNLDGTEFFELGARALVYQVEENDGGSWPPYRFAEKVLTDYERGWHDGKGLPYPKEVELTDVLPNIKEASLRRYDVLVAESA